MRSTGWWLNIWNKDSTSPAGVPGNGADLQPAAAPCRLGWRFVKNLTELDPVYMSPTGYMRRAVEHFPLAQARMIVDDIEAYIIFKKKPKYNTQCWVFFFSGNKKRALEDLLKAKSVGLAGRCIEIPFCVLTSKRSKSTDDEGDKPFDYTQY